jgi:hypothetical protein
MKTDSAGTDLPPVCPSCGGGQLTYLTGAEVRRRVASIGDDEIRIDAFTPAVAEIGGGRVVCDDCAEVIELDGRGVERMAPTLAYSDEALARGFASVYGEGSAAGLAKLPGGDIESLGEFVEEVVRRAVFDWSAIIPPVDCSIRLVALFPYADIMLPLVTVAGRRDGIAGRPMRRGEMENALGIGLGTRSIQTARAVCAFAVESANEVLEIPMPSMEFGES